jgi:Cytochrome P460
MTINTMLKQLAWSLLVTGVVGGTAAIGYAQGPARVAYPDGYRGWAHVKSMVIEKGHPLFESFGGIHHIYANASALRGYRSGKFADGSVIVFDLLDATRTNDSAVVEGARKVVGVMHKNSRLYASTGGWGYEGFKGDSRSERVVGAKAAEACHGCHTAQKAKDYVFSSYRK